MQLFPKDWPPFLGSDSLLVGVVSDLVDLGGPLLLGETVAVVGPVDDAGHDLVAAGLLTEHLLDVGGLEVGQGGALGLQLTQLRVLPGKVQLLLQEGQPAVKVEHGLSLTFVCFFVMIDLLQKSPHKNFRNKVFRKKITNRFNSTRCNYSSSFFLTSFWPVPSALIAVERNWLGLEASIDLKDNELPCGSWPTSHRKTILFSKN